MQHHSVCKAQAPEPCGPGANRLSASCRSVQRWRCWRTPACTETQQCSWPPGDSRHRRVCPPGAKIAMRA